MSIGVLLSPEGVNVTLFVSPSFEYLIVPLPTDLEYEPSSFFVRTFPVLSYAFSVLSALLYTCTPAIGTVYSLVPSQYIFRPSTSL